MDSGHERVTNNFVHLSNMTISVQLVLIYAISSQILFPHFPFQLSHFPTSCHAIAIHFILSYRKSSIQLLLCFKIPSVRVV